MKHIPITEHGVLLGSRPAEDWRHELSMAIQDFANSAHKIADALNGSPEQAAYIRSNARQLGEPLPLQLVCSVWMVMEGLGTTNGEASRTGHQYSSVPQVQEAAE